MATAKHRAIDPSGGPSGYARKAAEIGRRLEAEQPTEPDWAAALDEPSTTTSCGWCSSPATRCCRREARVALTLRLLGGLTTDEIARAFLVPEPTVAQRIVRAKRTLTAARVPFEVPAGADLTARLSSVLEVALPDLQRGLRRHGRGRLDARRRSAQEALRLGRVLAGLMPGESEVHGLVALMEIQASRLPARTDPDGEPVLLADQDRGRWDRLLIRRGLAALERAERPLGGRASARTRCRRRSPRATPAPARSRTPTGRGSPRSTSGWPS